MTARDRRALILGGVVIAAAVLSLRAVPWGVRRAAGSYVELRERAGLLARTREEMAALPMLRDSAATLSQALVALAPQLLSGRMNLAAARAPARVERLDPMPDSTSNGRLGRVRVRAALETDVRGLVALIRAIDAGDEVLRLEELHVEAPDPAAVNRGPEILKVEVTVSGWYVKPRDAGNGKRET